MYIHNIHIKIFHFNPIQVNTIVAYDDDANEAIIVDPGNSNDKEDSLLKEFILNHNLKVKAVLNTHPHIDHIIGNQFATDTFQAPLLMHAEAQKVYSLADQYAAAFDFPSKSFPLPNTLLNENDTINLGNQTWKVLYTPGHVDGSISLYDEQNQFVIVGDLLFQGSIGRTDLPTGNHSLLIQNINNKILTLNKEVIIIPGHGDYTTVAHEFENNPFLHD